MFLAILTLLAQQAAPSVPVAGSLPDPVCAFVADNDGKPFSPDVLSLWDVRADVERVIGWTGTSLIEAVAFSPFEAVLYATDGGILGALDLENGEFKAIGSVGNGTGSLGRKHFTDIDGLDFDPTSGVLFGAVRKEGSNLLIQINPSTGSIVDHAFGITFDYVPIGPMESAFSVDDIAVDPADGTLYAIANASVGSSRLLRIDKLSGAVTGVVDVAAEDVEGLTFGEGSTLLGTTGDDRRQVLAINKSTGAVSDRFVLGADGNRDYESIACRSGDRALPPFVPSDSRTPGDLLSMGSYPNPIRDGATVWVKTNKALGVRLEIFDLLGRRRAIISNGLVPAGESRWRYDAAALEPGIYVLQARTRLQRKTHEVIVVP